MTLQSGPHESSIFQSKYMNIEPEYMNIDPPQINVLAPPLFHSILLPSIRSAPLFFDAPLPRPHYRKEKRMIQIEGPRSRLI